MTVTVTALAPATAPAEDADPRTKELLEALDTDFLASVQWDWDHRVIFFPAEHLVLSRVKCGLVDCPNPASHGRLCSGCRRRWQESDMEMADFIASVKRTWRCVGQFLCQVPDCERPRRTVKCGLCDAHYAQQTVRKLSLENFLQLPGLYPMRRIGPCAVAACYRDRSSPRRDYCQAHTHRLHEARRRGTFQDEERWRRTESAIPVSGQVSLRGLPLRLVAEILYGFQLRTADSIRTVDQTLRRICDRARILGMTTWTTGTSTSCTALNAR